MTNHDLPAQPVFGCASCTSPPGVGEASPLTVLRVLLADPHEEYRLDVCPACGQVYLNHFKEVGHFDGEDDLWSRWVPLTGEEHAHVETLFGPEIQEGSHVAALRALMQSRPRLVRRPDGVYSWAAVGYDPCDLVRPGW
jgi:hypothetical protein